MIRVGPCPDRARVRIPFAFSDTLPPRLELGDGDSLYWHRVSLAVDGDPLHGHGIWRRSRFESTDDRLAWLFGFGAGVLGGAYGMNGPPLVAYGTLRRWSPEQFRATLQGYFLPASLVGMAGYWVAGLWVPAVTRYYLMSLPFVLAATALAFLRQPEVSRARKARSASATVVDSAGTKTRPGTTPGALK